MNQLIRIIGKQLNIPITDGSKSVCRIIYSVAGQIALSSLWDSEEGNNYVSVRHFKKRISDILDAYKSVDPETRTLLLDDNDRLCDEIFSIYLRCGFFYHSPHRVSPATVSISGSDGVILHRGFSPDENLYMSGLGFYSIGNSFEGKSIAQMFGLQEQNFENYLGELLGYSDWQPIEWSEDAEFLRINPPFSGGYWHQIPEKSDRISLARYGTPNRIYAFYRFESGRYWQKAIPEWRLRNCFYTDTGTVGEYIRIANALLNLYGTLPDIKVKRQGSLVEFNLGYLLPPTEEAFFKLFSWPRDYSGEMKNNFSREMSTQLYPLFKNTLTQLGYCFLEEHK